MDTEVRKGTFMNMRIRGAVTALAMLLAVGPVRAHHSIGVNFDRSRAVTLTGTLTKVS